MKKEYKFMVNFPLFVTTDFQKRVVESKIRSFSLNLDYENGYFHIFSVHEDGNVFQGTYPAKESYNFLEDCCCFYSDFEVFNVQKENEKELVSKKFSKRSRSKKS